MEAEFHVNVTKFAWKYGNVLAEIALKTCSTVYPIC